MRPLRIEVWSDIACPWCWVGKRHLEAAIAQVNHPVEVAWRAFELDPSAPKRHDPSVDYVARLASKYGTTRDGAQRMIDRMTSVGKERGLDFRFDRAKPSNTFDAHRLLAWAARHGKQGELGERLFKAYMNEGVCVGDPDALAELADDVGLDVEAARAVLSGDDFAQHVRDDEALAAELGVRGVPFFVIDQTLAVQGAQPTEAIVGALERALGQQAGLEQVNTHDACGPEGC
ncbi:MAG: DsbA family protein [Nannocystaceae bacterium]|nr:DsbA family oxidoreductase [bacterium]